MKNAKIRTPETQLVCIYTSSDYIKTELVKNMLADHGIQAEIGGEHQAGFAGTLDIEIIVRESDVDTARDLLRLIFQMQRTEQLADGPSH